MSQALECALIITLGLAFWVGPPIFIILRRELRRKNRLPRAKVVDSK